MSTFNDTNFKLIFIVFFFLTQSIFICMLPNNIRSTDRHNAKLKPIITESFKWIHVHRFQIFLLRCVVLVTWLKVWVGVEWDSGECDVLSVKRECKHSSTCIYYTLTKGKHGYNARKSFLGLKMCDLKFAILT